MTSARSQKFSTFALKAAAAARKDKGAPSILRAADVAAQPVEWLWPGRSPVGKVTLLVGDPGLGKSLISLDIAARLSRGQPWPDEEQAARSEEPDRPAAPTLAPRSSFLAPSSPLHAPCSVLILSAEDDLADTVRPRLTALGADCNRVFTLTSLVDLRRDFAQLRSSANSMPDCRLLIVDPINAYVGPADSHFHTVVHTVLRPLAKLAAKKRLAVLAIAHLRKLEGPAIHRAAGSIGYVAAARAVWTVCPDASEPGRMLFVPVKNNLTAAPTPLAYRIETHPNFAAPIIRWQRDAPVTSVEEALRRPLRPRGPEAEDRNAAARWLRRVLAGGPQHSLKTTMDAADHGFGYRTLMRAFHAIGAVSQKSGPHGEWIWSLPSAPLSGRATVSETPVPEKPIPEKPGNLETTCHLPEKTAI